MKIISSNWPIWLWRALLSFIDVWEELAERLVRLRAKKRYCCFKSNQLCFRWSSDHLVIRYLKKNYVLLFISLFFLLSLFLFIIFSFFLISYFLSSSFSNFYLPPCSLFYFPFSSIPSFLTGYVASNILKAKDNESYSLKVDMFSVSISCSSEYLCCITYADCCLLPSFLRCFFTSPSFFPTYQPTYLPSSLAS